MERWATFDCYGTLVDWNAGIHSELEKLFGVELADGLLVRYHELEPQIQASNPGASYREVLSIALEALAAETGLTLPEGETSMLARSLPEWPVFDDVQSGLGEAHERGWKLGILSNTDRDLIDASVAALGVPFELAIVASEIGSYKPAHKHWEVFYETTGADRRGHVHVAQSLFHDIEPADELGIPSIWINRLGETDDPRPSVTLTGVGRARGRARCARACVNGTLRSPNENDAEEVAQLLSEGSPEPIGPDSVLRDWSFPGVQIELDARFGSGSYAFVDGFGDGRVWVDFAGNPTTELLDWAEQRAHEVGSRVLSGGWTTHESLLRELERRGFALVRTLIPNGDRTRRAHSGARMARRG